MLHATLSILMAAATISAGEDLALLRERVEQPLVVNGEVVDSDVLKRSLVYGPGIGLLQLRVSDALLEIFAAQLDVPLPPFDRSAFEMTLTEFKAQLGGELADAAIRQEFGAPELAQWHLSTLARFDLVFLPVDPNQWPQVSLDALEGEGEVIQEALETYEKKIAAGKALRPETGLLHDYLRDTVRTYLEEQVEIRTYLDGLPDELVLEIRAGHGEPPIRLGLDQAFEELLPYLNPSLIEGERSWVAGLAAVRQSLQGRGLLLEQDDSQRRYERKLKEGNTFWSIETIALCSDYFPSREHYRAFFRLKQSFDQLLEVDDALMKAGELPDRLRQHLEAANQELGLGKVDLRVMHFSAWDAATGRVPEGGWKVAYERASRASLEISTRCLPPSLSLSNKEASNLWRELRARLSDTVVVPSFTDPAPNPKSSSSGCEGCRLTCYGGPVTLRSLQLLLGSTDYSDLKVQAPNAQWVFYEQELGSLSPPLLTPRGYALVWLRARHEPTNPLRLADKHHQELLRKFALEREFETFWRETIRTSVVR